MKFLFLLSLLVLNAHAEINRDWEEYSDPSIRGSGFERYLSKLPLHGAPASTGNLWASDYWARKKGSINIRWNSRSQQGFKLVSPTREQAHMMSRDQLAQLAPTEKLDLLNGDYEYTLVKEVEKV